MTHFREALESNSLFDMGCQGGFFTWSNIHTDNTFTKERLDRCVANNLWRAMFKEIRVEGLAGRSSDHLPVLLSMMGNEERQGRRNFPFRFEASWIKEEGCEQLVRQG